MDKSIHKVLFFGYYDDFAHFFAKVANTLLEEMPHVYPIFVSGFISGWLAWARHARGRESVFLTPRLFILTQWFRIRYWRTVPPSAFCGHAPKLLLKYDFLRTGRYSGIPALLARIHVFERLFRIYAPTYLVVSGDSRVSARVCIAVARKYGCKIGYFEQGPFGTSFLDQNGVNADLTVPIIPEDVSNSPAIPAIPSNRASPELRTPWLRAIDYFLSYLPGWPSEFQSRLNIKWPNAKRKYPSLNVAVKRQREFLFALQVPNDANFIVHTDFSDFETALRLAAAALPENAVLAVREHPKFQGAYGAKVYNLIAGSPQMYLQKNISSLDALDCCAGVITLNSMMGLEAMLASRPVLLLGRSYFQALCQVPNGPHNSFSALQDFYRDPFFGLNLRNVSWFWSALLRETAISGHFRDAGMHAATEFARKIKNELE